MMAFACRYYYYNQLKDGFVVLIFPPLKAFFIWINIEFTFRYFKTVQILKTFIHANPFEQIKAQEPSVMRRKRITDICVLSSLMVILLTGTVLMTVGFQCYQDNNDEKTHMSICKSLIVAGQFSILFLRSLTYGAELWAIWTIYKISDEHSQKLSEEHNLHIFHILIFTLAYIFDIAITALTVTG